MTNRTLITGSADGTVRFWDIETAQSLHIIDLVRLPLVERPIKLKHTPHVPNDFRPAPLQMTHKMLK